MRVAAVDLQAVEGAVLSVAQLTHELGATVQMHVSLVFLEVVPIAAHLAAKPAHIGLLALTCKTEKTRWGEAGSSRLAGRQAGRQVGRQAGKQASRHNTQQVATPALPPAAPGL
ncbi:hypothetical protein E2C01_024256 [Portunus trituberculatus]|uniref:Uncharacterized protein n=1 Tax=Portunus trituberculatus TaxID=210409 RepID=A0A5B7EE37_PORTR|nr:hypothetical protein [Portunus trituberculatus]